MYNHYNKQLKDRARSLRKEMTKAEVCLWKYALRGSMTGAKFNRQRPVLDFIADFMCKPLKLIIEVDGYSHLLEHIKNKDERRQKVLECHDFTVLRFTDEDVLKDIENVRRVIEAKVRELKLITSP